MIMRGIKSSIPRYEVWSRYSILNQDKKPEVKADPIGPIRKLTIVGPFQSVLLFVCEFGGLGGL